MLYNNQIVGFSKEQVKTKSDKFDERSIRYKIVEVRYVIAYANTSYNVLLGEPSVNKLRR